MESNIKTMSVSLTAVCLVCAAILGSLYAVTKAPIEAAALAEAKAAIAEVLPQGEISEAQTAELDGVTYEYYACTQDTTVLAYAVKSSTNGFGGMLSLMVGVQPDGTIYNTKVLSHSETPGLGAKCTDDPKFTSQWKGFEAAKTLSVKKDGGDVDAITASTITSRAYTVAVAQARKLVQTLNKEEE